MRIFHRHKGFSLLMALGITAVLLIMVVGLALVYMRELKLSRLSYDEVLSSASAEGLFEYGMLKVRNHADGFQDSVRAGSGEDFDADGKMFALSELRSAGMNMEYSIEANSTGATFTLSGGEHLIIPLFVDAGEEIKPGSDSKKPQKNTSSIEPTEWLQVKGIDDQVSWVIVASDAISGENIGLQGKWAIKTGSTGDLQLKQYKCTYVTAAGSLVTFESSVPCKDDANQGAVYDNSTQKEELLYFYRVSGVSVSDFLDANKKVLGNSEEMKRSEPYLILYNQEGKKAVSIESTKPFSLPQYTITATARKGDASQVFRFQEDKSRYYDALKYGYYGTDNNSQP